MLKPMNLTASRVVLISPFMDQHAQQAAEASFLFDCCDEIMKELLDHKIFSIHKGEPRKDENGIMVRDVTVRLQVVRQHKADSKN